MASAVGMAVLDAIKEDKCQENSLEVGTYLMEQLVKLVDKYEIVGDVRGKGLMIGNDFISTLIIGYQFKFKEWRW